MLGESSPSLNQNNVHVKVFFNTRHRTVCELSVVSWMCGTVLKKCKSTSTLYIYTRTRTLKYAVNFISACLSYWQCTSYWSVTYIGRLYLPKNECSTSAYYGGREGLSPKAQQRSAFSPLVLTKLRTTRCRAFTRRSVTRQQPPPLIPS